MFNSRSSENTEEAEIIKISKQFQEIVNSVFDDENASDKVKRAALQCQAAWLNFHKDELSEAKNNQASTEKRPF